MNPSTAEIDFILENALREDLGKGDITSEYTIPVDKTCSFKIIAKEEMIVCGVEIATIVFKKINPEINIELKVQNGQKIKKDSIILEGEGDCRSVLAAERTALNFLGHMSGVATITNKFVKEIAGTKAKILDTRKTIPGLRTIQKYAVKIGGGVNHRMRLDDGILIKDNHISIAGSVEKAVALCKEKINFGQKIEVECDTIEQVKEALNAKPDIILLDNMDIKTMQEAVKITDGKAILEASGNVNIDNVKQIAETGVDFISIGKLTHSVRCLDVSLDID